MPLSMPSARSRQADELQRALERRLTGAATASGAGRATSASTTAGTEIGGYVEVAARLADLVPTTSLRPDPAYRAELHSRLLELASARAASRPVQQTSARDRRAGAAIGIGAAGAIRVRRWRRAVATSFAAVLALMLGVGVAAGSALPGGLLYPVKELIQSTQVRFAHGDLARGNVLLDQARGHIADALTLVSQGSPDPADVDTALQQASDDVGRGSQLLLARYAAAHDPDALADLARFTTSQSPLLSRLRDRVPVVSQPLVDRLLAQLGANSTTIVRTVSQCGSPCASVPLVNLPGADGLPAATPGGLPITQGSSGTSGGAGSVGSVPGLGGLLGGGGTGAGTGTGGGAASLGSGGASVNLPGVGATVPAPHVGVSSGGVHVGVPGASATLGPVTVTVPGVGLGLGAGQQSSSSTHPPVNTASTPPPVCVLIVCLGG